MSESDSLPHSLGGRCDDQVVTYLIFFRSEIDFSVSPLFVVFPL